MATQVDKLILQTEGKERIAELTVLLKAEAEAMRELIALRDLGRISQARYDAGMRNAATAAVGYEKQIAAVEKGVRSFSLVGKNAQLGFMELSYVLQDFVQGGIGGILNNLPRVVTLFGGPIGLGAAVGAAGVAVFVFRQQLADLWETIAGGAEGIPKATTRLGELDDKLKGLKDRMEAMAVDGLIPVDKLNEYNDAAAKRAELEERIAKAKEAQSRYDALKKKVETNALGLNAETAAVVEDTVQDLGGPDKVRDMVRDQMAPESAALDGAMAELRKIERDRAEWKRGLDKERETARSMGNLQGLPAIDARERAGMPGADKRTADAQRRIALAREDLSKKAEDLLGRAGQGDQSAVEELAKRFPGSNFVQGTKEYIDRQDAEEKADAKDADRAHEAGVKRRAQKARDDADEKYFSSMRENTRKRLEATNNQAVLKEADEQKRAEDFAKAQDKARADRLQAANNQAVVAQIKTANAPRDAVLNRLDSDRVSLVNDAQAGAMMGRIDPGDVLRIRNRSANAVGAVRGTVAPRDLEASIQRNEAQLMDLQAQGRMGDPTWQAIARLEDQLQRAMHMLRVQKMQRAGGRRGGDVGVFPAFPMYGG